MVSFRLSGAEYAAAEMSCQQHGVRSVSSLARDATLRAARAHREKILVSESEILLQLQHQILTLRTQLDQLSGLVVRPAESDGHSLSPTSALRREVAD
jgi:hypothetical protein